MRKEVTYVLAAGAVLLALLICAGVGYRIGQECKEQQPKKVIYRVEDGRISSVDISTIALVRNVYEITDEEVAVAASQTGMTEEETREQMEATFAAKAEDELKSEAMLAVCDAADTFEISDERLSEYEQSMLDAYEDLRVQFNSDDINDIYTLFSTSEDQIREDARNLLKERMAVGMVIDDNGLYPDDDAMQAAMEALAEADGTDLDSYLEEYGESYAQYAVLYDIASSYVTEHATVTENTVPSDWLPSASDDDGAEDDTGTEVTETTEATEG